MSAEDIITSTQQATAIIERFGLTVYSQIASLLRMPLSQGSEYTAEELSISVQLDYEGNLSDSEISEAVGMFLSIPVNYAGAIAGVTRILEGELLFARAADVHRKINELRATGQDEEYYQLIALQSQVQK